jgi:superfamily II DNA helicase RecQ
MARLRPSTPDAFLEVKGVGARKSRQYAKQFLAAIKAHCGANSLDLDAP